MYYLENIIQLNEYTYRNGIWHWKMCHVDNEKGKKKKRMEEIELKKIRKASEDLMKKKSRRTWKY